MAQVMLTFAGTLATLKSRALPAAAVTVPFIIAYASADLRMHDEIHNTGYALTALTLFAAVVIGYWASVIKDYEAYFKARVWMQGSENSQRRRQSSLWRTELKESKCAFTGSNPDFLCLPCKQFVSSKYYHREEKPEGSSLFQLISMGFGRTYLLLDRASVLVTEMNMPVLARVELDESLDFEGNFLTGKIGHCCAACYNQYRLWHLLPRLATSAFFSSFVFLLGSMAIKIDVLEDAKSVWGIVKPLCLVISLFLAGAMLSLVLESVYASRVFLQVANAATNSNKTETKEDESITDNVTLATKVDRALKVYFGNIWW